jgi:hypothetical protein
MAEYLTKILREDEKDSWNKLIEEGDNGTIFHYYDWLKIAAEHSRTELIPLIITKGNKRVCQLPLFKMTRGGLKFVFSPPPGCGLPYLGPVFSIPAGNRHNYESTYFGILDEIIRFIRKEIGYDYLKIVNSEDLPDMRPYLWQGFQVKPLYSYTIDLTQGMETVHSGIYKKTKNALKQALNNENISISREDRFIDNIITLVGKRYGEQNRKYKISHQYINNLKESSIGEKIEVISILADGEFAGGDITLADKAKAYAWIGSVDRDRKVTGAGERVLWEKMKDYCERGFHSYDIVGGNTRHLCEHKSKYGPELIVYYQVTDTSFKGKISLKLFRKHGTN